MVSVEEQLAGVLDSMVSVEEQLAGVLDSYQRSCAFAQKRFVVESKGDGYRVLVEAFGLCGKHDFVLTRAEVELILKRHRWMVPYLKILRLEGISLSTYCKLLAESHLYLFSDCAYVRQVARRLVEGEE